MLARFIETDAGFRKARRELLAAGGTGTLPPSSGPSAKPSVPDRSPPKAKGAPEMIIGRFQKKADETFTGSISTLITEQACPDPPGRRSGQSRTRRNTASSRTDARSVPAGTHRPTRRRHAPISALYSTARSCPRRSALLSSRARTTTTSSGAAARSVTARRSQPETPREPGSFGQDEL